MTVFTGVRFISLPNEDLFEKVVANYVDAMRPTAVLTGEKKKILSRPPQDLGNGSRITYQDEHITFGDGLLVQGPAAHEVSTAVLASQVLNGRRLPDAMLKLDFSNIPAKYRRALIQQLERQVGVRLQQTDAETAASYAIRRTLGDTYSAIAKSMLLDIKSVDVECYLASKSKPFRLSIKIATVDKSRLAKVLESLRIRNTRLPRSDVSDGEFASIGLCARLPSGVISPLQAMLEKQQLPPEIIAGLKRTIDERRTEAHVSAQLLEGTRLAIVGSALAQTQGVTDSILVSVFPKGTSLSEGRLVGELPEELLPGISHFAVQTNSNHLDFTLGAADEPFQSHETRSRGTTTPLLSAELDLLPFVQTKSGLDWLSKFEETYDRWRVGKKKTPASFPFQAFAKKLALKDGLGIRLSVRESKKNIVVALEVDQAVAAYAAVRHLGTMSRLYTRRP